MKLLLKPRGVITIEFPHLMRLVEGNQFDTIYHEHFSYFSFLTAERIFAKHGLTLFDVEELKSHGGSIRIYGRHKEEAAPPVSERVNDLREREIKAGYERMEHYSSFGERVAETKRKLLQLLIEVKAGGNRIVGYGAPGKGNTLLNYCGIRSDFLDYTVDRNPYKHGRFTPGTHIEILQPERICEDRPDFLLILPWNLKSEIVRQMSFIKDWGGGLSFQYLRRRSSVIFNELPLKGVFLIEMEKLQDDRGFFARSYCAREFEQHGLNPRVVQCNVSFSKKRGTLRGLHYQGPRGEEAKLVRCTAGALYDVVVDLRKDSRTYLGHEGFRLDSQDRLLLFVPEGFAHGFITLKDNTEVSYQMSEFL